METVYLREKQYGFCKGCLVCQKLGHCVIKDDAVEIIEAEAESPMAYVLANKHFPNVTVLKDDSVETVIEARNDAGYKTRYTFTE